MDQEETKSLGTEEDEERYKVHEDEELVSLVFKFKKAGYDPTKILKDYIKEHNLRRGAS